MAARDDSLDGGRSADDSTVSGPVVRVGRASDNDIVVGDLQVAGHHASFSKASDGCWQLHLERRATASVKGQPAPERIEAGTTVRVGNVPLLVSADGVAEVAPSDHDLVASDLMVIKDGQTILSDVSFVVPPNSLVAVLGPSGSGKTTLLNALTGVAPADSGDVLYCGTPVYDEYEDVRRAIGLVPQEDLLHATLTVDRALSLAARLRFAPDVEESEVDQRIEEVLDLLGLSKHRSKRVGQLSGGQRKRTSVAMGASDRQRLPTTCHEPFCKPARRVPGCGLICFGEQHGSPPGHGIADPTQRDPRYLAVACS